MDYYFFGMAQFWIGSDGRHLWWQPMGRVQGIIGW
jgi:hypothetical protein